jgi:hypothetical protein
MHSAILDGGPGDGATLEHIESPVVVLELDGGVYRYVTNGHRHERDGTSYTVYTYDGEIDVAALQHSTTDPR